MDNDVDLSSVWKKNPDTNPPEVYPEEGMVVRIRQREAALQVKGLDVPMGIPMDVLLQHYDRIK